MNKVCLALALLFSCSASEAEAKRFVKPAPHKQPVQQQAAAPAPVQKPKPEPSLPYEVIAAGDHSDLHLFQTVVVQSKTDFDQLWKRHNPKESAPFVDFENATVLALFGGQKTSAGYKAEIVSVSKNGNFGYKVKYRITRPPAGGASASVMTQPFQLVKLHKLSGNFAFASE